MRRRQEGEEESESPVVNQQSHSDLEEVVTVRRVRMDVLCLHKASAAPGVRRQHAMNEKKNDNLW